MLVDTTKIINDTISVFNTPLIHKHFQSLESISVEDYNQLHTSPLVPLNINIDVPSFLTEIEEWLPNAQQWGKSHLHLPRKALALVNEDGAIKENDPINGSLYEWNLNNPENPILETNCVVPTSIMFLKSLQPLSMFDGHWCRSNLLVWEKDAEFKPHVDTLIPSYWFRLWGTTSNNIKLRFAENDQLKEHPDVEPGRIYLINTALVHDAYCKEGNGIQFFLSVLPSALKVIKELRM